MSKFYKFTSMLFVFILLFNTLSPIETAQAAGPNTNLTVHKIKGEKARTSTYDELNGNVPANVEKISNIKFTYWKVSKENYNTMQNNQANYQTIDQVKALVGTSGTTTAPTDGGGQTKIDGLAEGYYWFVENKSAAVIKSAAVPFGLALPLTNEARTGYITDLHVYPKNTLAPTPTIDETISGGINGKTKSADIGQNIVWNIKPTVPRGIEEYQDYTVVSRIHDHLDFDEKSVNVSYNGTTLVKGSDYTVSFSPETRELIVTCQKAGLEKMGAAWNDSESMSTLNIAMNTHINDQALMGHSIENTAKINFDNGHGIRATSTVDTPPSVHTGGKKFVKVDDAGKKLSGAKFVILNSDGKYVKQNQENHDVVWVDKQSEATLFTSNENGAFEVRGLAYSKVDAEENVIPYKLKEIEAPSGYALPTETIASFVVDANSYSSNALEVVNKKITIPDTGGTGTILFTVAGLALMVLALVLIRKRKQA